MTLTKKYAHIWKPYLHEGETKKKSEITLADQTVLAIYILVRLWCKNECTFMRRTPFVDYRERNTAASAANWLFAYRPGIRYILCRAALPGGCYPPVYERILEELICILLNKESLENASKKPARGNVFPCAGPFNKSAEVEMLVKT